MAGQILLLSCLLAICLPIIFVQLPRFEAVRELHAENDTETRSSVLRQRPLLRSRKTLRRITRPWSETDVDITSAESEQEQGISEQGAQTTAGRWLFQGDASADRGASSKAEDELRKARAGKKPWDPPFRKQLFKPESVGNSPGGRRHAVEDASPTRKTGRDLEFRGVAKRLFPPDPIPEKDDVDEYNRRLLASSGPPQTPQEPLHRRPPPKNNPGAHDVKRQASPQEHHSRSPLTRSMPPQRTDLDSLPSPLDGSPLPSTYHLPQGVLTTKIKEHSNCLCKHCRHHCSGSGLTDLQPENGSETPNNGPKTVRDKNLKCACKEVDGIANKEPPKPSSKAPKSDLRPWQVLLVILGLIIFVFAFAILIAHCLAWFLVYKTEARLGDARSGLLRGGEMKLCLCSRG